MEETTIFIHQTKDEEPIRDKEIRIVRFINGNKDILHIIKKIIKDKY